MKGATKEKLFLWMQRFAPRAADIALRYQKGVKKTEKQSVFDLPSYASDSASRAKTIADDSIQELCLAELFTLQPRISVNAEEETPLKKLFPLTSKHVFHVDPIDGTLSYASGGKRFAIGMGISDYAANFTHTVICFPAYHTMYAASPQNAFIVHAGEKTRIPSYSQASYPIIYEKRLLSFRGRRKLQRLGFYIKKPESAHMSIIEVALGKAAASLHGGINVHDGLLPFPFAKACGIIPFTAKGISLRHISRLPIISNRALRFERIPSVCYLNSAVDASAVLAILSDPENLHEVYRKQFAHREPVS